MLKQQYYLHLDSGISLFFLFISFSKLKKKSKHFEIFRTQLIILKLYFEA